MWDELTQINWEDFHFIRPVFLWLLVPLFLSMVLGLLSLREEVKWQKVIAPHLRPYIIKKGSEHLKRRMQLLLFLLTGMAILGLSGPTWRTIEVPGKTLETPVLVILDLSQSMMADDIEPSRLERAQFKISDFLEAGPGARVGLIAFAGTAHTIVPLSSDYKIISSHLEGLSPDIMPYPGTNLEAALQLADTLMRVTEAPGRIILFSDDFDESSFDILQNYVLENNNTIEIFPMNTSGGAVLPLPGRQKVHSALNQGVMTKLSSLDGITVHQLTLDNSDVEFLAADIAANLEFQEEEEKKEDDWLDRGLLFAFPFALFVLMAFRRGRVVFTLVFISMLYSCEGERSFSDLWLSRDFQAQKAYDDRDFEDAAELFTDPLRKGLAYYQAGSYENAIEWFSRDSTAMGAYNLGLARYKNGDYVAAGQAFARAVEMDPEMENARNNQEMVQQIIAGMEEANPDQVNEAPAEESAENVENKDPEDLGGGGQEATKEDMEKERKEETVATDMRKGKELDEVPDDFESGSQDESQKVLMRKVDENPALFLKRKFAHQAKTKNLKPESEDKKW